MIYTARTLITRAYYLSQIVRRDLQTVSGSQISDGLFLLNNLLDFKSSDLRLIPYFSRGEFDTQQGIDNYFIDNLLYVDAMTFNLGKVRFNMISDTRKEFFNSPRVDDIQSLMYKYRAERENGGMRIYFYFSPSQVFKVKYSGKFGLSEVTLDQDMALTYDGFYIEYLRYALAEYICSDYGVTFPDESKAKLMEMERKLMDVDPADIVMVKRSYFGRQFGLDWQTANLTTGWVP